MFDRNLNMRIDDSTNATLKKLMCNFNFSKSEIVRKSLRLMEQLTELEKRHGEIHFFTKEGEKILVLLS